MKTLSTFFAFMLPVSLAWAASVVTLEPNTTVTVANNTEYKLTATSVDKVTEFTLESSNTSSSLKPLNSNLVIQTYVGNTTTQVGNVIVNLKNVYLSHATPVLVYGPGTVTFVITGDTITGDTRFEHTAQADGIVLDADEANVHICVKDSGTLRVVVPTSASDYENCNVLPIAAKTLTIEEGKLRCFALSKGDSAYGTDYPLTPCIVTETLTFASESASLECSFFVTETINNAAAIAAKQIAPVKYTTLNCTTGTITENAIAYPTAADAKLYASSRYKYPVGSQEKLKADAKGGTVFGVVTEPEDPAENTKTFSFPNWEDFPTTAADYIACFKSATTGANPPAEAITIDAENKTVTIDTTLCPDPEIVCTETGRAGAISLFGVNPTLTENGMQVSYNFGISGIALIDGTIQMDVAVELPYETADTKEFFITVTIEDGSAIFKDNLTFTRVEGTNLFRSARIDTKEDPRLPDFTFHTYHVSASEAKSVTE